MAERVFTLPDLGEGLEEAVVTQWLIAEGDVVELNQPIAEIETAKAVVEVPSPFAGKVVRLHAEAGSTVSVGSALVTFEVEAGDAPPREGRSAPSDRSASLRAPAPTDLAGRRSVAATPAVRKLAKDLGVDLATVTPSGQDRRVTREDVEAASGARGAADDAEVVEVSPVRKAIADNLMKVAAIPQVTTFRQVDCTAIEAARAELGVSPLPLFVRALAEVCSAHPMLNASWEGDRILVHRTVNAGIATDTERGLMVPVVRNVRTKGVVAIAEEMTDLAQRARSNALVRDDLAGATIAVTNTGSYGSEFGTPLLNPGHAITIALGVIEPRPLILEGRVEARPACTLSLTFDHRVLDGATVGRALGALVELLESPERLAALPR
jgi:2-oxoisovalerate dehydrogenase E2 component (dihydrolipoyl transacylase)